MTISPKPNLSTPMKKSGATFGSIIRGAEIASEAGFTTLVADDFSSYAVGSTYPGWSDRSTVDTTRAASGTQSLLVRTQPGREGPNFVSGSTYYGGRSPLPVNVPEGKKLWVSYKVYHPARFSWGYMYNGSDNAEIFTGGTTGATTLEIDNGPKVNVDYVPGMYCAVKLDNGTWHLTTMDAGTSGTTVVLTDPLPSPVSATPGNEDSFFSYDRAEAKHSEAATGMVEQIDGVSVLKYMVVSKSEIGKIYYQPVRSRRAIARTGTALIATEGANNSRTEEAPWPLIDDAWNTIQMEVYAHSDPTLGYVRIWLGETLVSEVITNTLSSSTETLTEWGMGSYWNGQPYTDDLTDTTRTDFWIDEVIVATDMDGYGAPTGIDPGGRTYIDPTTTVAELT